MAKLQPDYVKWVATLDATQAQKEFHNLEKATRDLKTSANSVRKEIVELEKTGQKGSQEWKNLKQSLAQYNHEIETNREKMKEVSKRFDTSTMSIKQLTDALKKARSEFNNTSKAVDPNRYEKLRKEIATLKGALDKADASTRNFKQSFFSLEKAKQVLIGGLTQIGITIVNQIVNAFEQAVSTIQDFERANSRLAAVLGTSRQGVSKLTAQAKLLGRTTTATASEVTGLQTELAKLGFSQEVIEQMTPATLKFAKAVDTDLASAAAFAGAAMRMFKKDAADAESVMATFAVATTNSALDFDKLNASLATVGPVANALGFSLEDTTALLGALSNAGFDASSAATASRNILLGLADSSGDLAKALGTPVHNLDDLVAGMNKLNAEGIDLAKALDLTDKRSVTAFATFLSGTDTLLDLRDSITDCTGDFNQMAATMGDNAAGSWAGFQSAVEGLILKFSAFTEALKVLYQWATEFVNWIGEWIDSLSGLAYVAEYTAKAFGAIVGAIGSVVKWLSQFITNTKTGRAILNGLVAALVAYKVAQLAASNAVKTFIKDIVASIKSLALKAVATYQDAVAAGAAAAAQRAWNAAMMANPFLLVISLIAMVVAGMVGYNSTIDESTEKTDAWTEANQEASKQFGEQKGKIEALIMVAENENISLERRKKAVNELNRIIPDYNARIDETTGKYVAAKEKLDAYLASLEKEMRYKANEDKLRKLVAEEEEARYNLDEALIREQNSSGTKTFHWQTSSKEEARDARIEAQKIYEEKMKNRKAFKAHMDKDLAEGKIIAPTADTADSIDKNVTKPLNSAHTAATKVVDKLKEINGELKELRKRDPKDDDELKQIQERRKTLLEEKRTLEGKKKTKKKKHTPGTYGEDSLAQVAAPYDDEFQKRLLEINKEDIPEVKKVIKKNEELIQYCAKLNEALEEMKKNTDKTHKKTLDAITAEQNALAKDTLTAQLEINKAKAQIDSDSHKQRLEASEVFYSQRKDMIKASVIADSEMEQASGIWLMELESQSHKDRLAELQRYYAEVAEADYYSVDERSKIFAQLGKDMRQLQSQILTDQSKLSETLREATTDTTSIQGIKADLERRKNMLRAYYNALKEHEEVSAEQAAALDAEKNRRLAALDDEYADKLFELQQYIGLSWAKEYDHELEELERYHRKGLISEKEYQKKKLDLQVQNVKKYFDYYAELSGSMFTAIQDAEIATSDAKYDVLIQQAKNNGEDTAALEEEKENKKLEIQKRYADVNFAIKVSQIVADTAVSIMKAYAELGPIAGSIAAAMLSATGVAQLAAANAEREKIKKLEPSSSATSSTASTAETPTAERVLTGYSEGGYTGDGGRYEVAGVVHKGEYVVPKPIMSNPRVIDAVGMIESIRRNRAVGTPDRAPRHREGFAKGGYTSQISTEATADFRHAIKELRSALGNIRANVVYKDIERAGEGAARARSPFTRNR